MNTGKCTVVKSGEELMFLVKEKIESKLLDKLKGQVFARVPSSRVKEYVEGVNVGFRLSVQSPDLKLLQVEYIYDSLLFDISNRGESDVLEAVKGIREVKRYTEAQLLRMMVSRAEKALKEPHMPDYAKVWLGMTRDEFLEAHEGIHDWRRRWVPRVFKEVKVLLGHPDMTNEIWTKVQNVIKVHG